jgi:hypothetical protein
VSGRLTPEQASRLSTYVKGQRVHDLGAGNLALSSALLGLGARTVVAVDAWLEPLMPDTDQLYLVPSYFDQYVATDPKIDFAFISWPPQYAVQGLAELTRRARMVADDGSVCGNTELWTELVKRVVVAEVRARQNTLIVYGPVVPGQRMLLPEEYAALRCQIDPIHEFGSLDEQPLLFP